MSSPSDPIVPRLPAKPVNFLRLSDLDLKGKRVFIRADLNVPQDDAGHITDDTRIRASLPGIRAALDAGAAVMVTSHLGRPTEGEPKPADSLAPIAVRLGELLGRTVPLVADWVGGVAVAPGQLVLLENCRCNKGEKKNDETLARKMAALCDIYVNDAFGTAHRAEATTHGIARFAPVACAGPLMAAELDALAAALRQPKRPLLAIVAGSKVSTKLSILRSLAEPDMLDEARAVIAKMRAKHGSVPIPVDVVTGKAFSATAVATTKAATDVAADDMIFDIGPRSAAGLTALIRDAGTIVWNGPVGVFEFDQFGAGTRAVAEAIAGSKAFSIAGGGDTLAAIAKYGVTDRIGYISTGGGAFLEFLEGKALPAVEMLEQRANG